MEVRAIAARSKKIYFDFSQSQSQLLIVQTVRMAFLCIVFLVTLAFQLLNPQFVSFDIFFSVYLLLATSFFLNCLYIVYLDRQGTFSGAVTVFMFAWETIYISLLIYFIGINQSLLIFLYLINIILCGVIFQRKGGVYLALLTSVGFSFLLAIDKTIQGNTLYLAVGVNNLAFFTVAYLSGYLSEQLNFMGIELVERGRDIKVLKNINTLIINSMDSGLLTLDIDGLVLQHNDRALKILSESQSLIGRRVDQFVEKVLVEKRKNFSLKTIDITYSQAEHNKVLRVHISDLNDERGECKGSILLFEDITHLKALESRLLQSEKMAAIGQLAAGIAHEIRNPLASISGSVQLLQVDALRSDDDKKLMSIVIKEIDRLNNLITEFLDYARPSNIIKEEIVVTEFIQELLEVVRRDNLAKDVTIDLDLQENLKIGGQPDKLKQAFLNIIMNALQAMEKRKEKVLSIQSRQLQDTTQLRIKDSGEGISKEQLPKIFEPFHTTKPKGTGLGLAIVHSILEIHGAHVQVDSELGRGAEFIISFPRN